MRDERDHISKKDAVLIASLGLEGMRLDAAGPSANSLPWRVGDFDKVGALCDEQISELAARFDFGIQDVRRLSRRLGFSLSSVPHLVRSVEELGSVKSGRAAAEAALSRVRYAKRLLEGANQSASDLRPRWDLPPTDRDFIAQSIASLRQAQASMSELELDFARLAGPEHLVIRPRLVDERHLPDDRRRWVLGDIFAFWRGQGRKLTYTTVPDTSERRGGVFQFVNAVLECVTEPRTKLGVESIVKELRAWKKGFLAWESGMQSFKDPNSAT